MNDENLQRKINILCNDYLILNDFSMSIPPIEVERDNKFTSDRLTSQCHIQYPKLMLACPDLISGLICACTPCTHSDCSLNHALDI